MSEARDKTQPKRPARSRLRDWLVAVGLVVCVMTPLRSSVADWNDVPSGSMRPTILEGDRIYVDKLAYGLRVPLTKWWIARWAEPSRGDIITFASPVDGTRLVKRIVGLPGDRVMLKDNRLFINGVPMRYVITDDDAVAPLPSGLHVSVMLGREAGPTEGESDPLMRPHAVTFSPGMASPTDVPELTVPAGSVYVLGDNRDQSTDSRFIGPVPIRSIYGRATAVALSFDPEIRYLPRSERWFTRLR